jgi:centromeric protein E
VRSVEHALALVARGNAQRKVSATQFNADSSRSHTLCQVTIESCSTVCRDDRSLSQFNLIDLAGSESARAAASDSGRRREGSYINKSLLTLGAVIAKLSEGAAVHIPFRDSKLTRLLQGSLSGRGARIAVVCCITPAAAQVRSAPQHPPQDESEPESPSTLDTATARAGRTPSRLCVQAPGKWSSDCHLSDSHCVLGLT